MALEDVEILTEALRSRFPVVYADFRSIDRFLYRVRDLGELPDLVSQDLIRRLEKCHLYMICKRPRLSVVPTSINWTDEHISLKVSCPIRGVTHEGELRIFRPAHLRAAKSFSSSPFPHRELLALDESGNVISQMLFANMAHLIDSLPAFAKQLEVLYIGKGLSGNAQDRLANHATLQNVLAQVNSDDPEAEVFALVYSFDYRRSVGGLIKSETDKEKALNLRKTIPRYAPTLEDRISLIEAAAISYFQTTKYNSHYLGFPASDTNAARRAREAGTEFIAVQIDTENIGGVPIFSQSINPAATHFIVRSIAR